MATEKTYKSTTSQDIDIDLVAGEITVEATDEVGFVEVIIRTKDDEGQSAETVRGARFREYLNDVLGLRVPAPEGASGVVFGGNGGMIVANNVTGGVSIIGSRVYVGGREVTSDSRGGMVISGPSKIQVIVRMPKSRALVVNTTSSSVLAKGKFDRVDLKTVSGNVTVHEVTGEAKVKSVSGSTAIDRWAGRQLSVKTVSGSITVVNAENATGSIDAATVSGSIFLGGARHLQVNTSTISGQVHRS